MSPSEADGRGAGRIEAAFEKIRSDGRVGLMTHIVAGYPDLDTSRALIERMVELGVDIIEIQIPFSDPTADGPTITKACQDALDGGVRVADAFAFMSEVTEEYPATPFLFMSYFNIAFAYRDATAGGHGVEDGVAGFVGASKACGASGLILPDVPPDMTREGYPEACREHGLHPIYVVSPNIGDDRIEAISRESSGFVYATSRTGPTGKAVNPDITPLESFLARTREKCELPLAVGFSISKREHVEALSGHAELAVVGSHLIRALETGGVDEVGSEIRRLQGS